MHQYSLLFGITPQDILAELHIQSATYLEDRLLLAVSGKIFYHAHYSTGYNSRVHCQQYAFVP